MERISRESILKEMQVMAWHNVLCYSKNYLMDEPKDGSREEWEQAMAKAKIIDEMYEEIKSVD